MFSIIRCWCLYIAARDRRLVALHHLIHDAVPQHRAAFIHDVGEEVVCLVISDSFPVVNATIQCDVDTESQESDYVLR